MAPDVEFLNTMTPNKRFDPATFDVLRVSGDDLAAEITRGDLEVFKRISVSELTSGAWSKKEKYEKAANIVEFTRRFNSLGHLARSEILNGQTPERRAQLISFFIKLAKKLYQLNNLHGTFAIISALDTQGIFRLEKSWEKVSSKDRHTKQRLADLFSENENFRALRAYMDATSTPCIPHLGMYLTDLVFMADMNKKTRNARDQLRNEENTNKILRQLCSFQDSVYEDLPYLPHIQAYLQSAEMSLDHSTLADRERTYYELSLRCEPPTSIDEKTAETPRRSSLPLNAIRGTKTPASATPNGSVPSTEPRKKPAGFSPVTTLAGRWKRGKHATPERTRDLAGIENASFAQSPLDLREAEHEQTGDCSPPSSARHTIERWQLTPRRDAASVWYDDPAAANSTTTDDSSLDERDSWTSARFHRSGSAAQAGALVSDLWKKLRLSEMADGAARKLRSPRRRSGSRTHTETSPTGQFSYSASNTPQSARRRFFGTWTPGPRRESHGTSGLAGHFGRVQEDESDEEDAASAAHERRAAAIVDHRPLLAEPTEEPELSGVFTKTQVRGSRSKTKLLRTHQCVYVELRGTRLFEYERRTIPLHAADERALFQRHPKRVLELRAADPAHWHVQRPSEDHRPGFELVDARTGRVFHFACRTWTIACHWLRTLSECAQEAANDLPTGPPPRSVSTGSLKSAARRRLTAAVEAQDRGFESTRL
ncbi:Ras-GEF domain-containing protein [Aphelenchoides fujianensis]|nr:Ras-GEF domain-containing protein [Aphelenchoides fujianensis]